jgi:hypothetical protein
VRVGGGVSVRVIDLSVLETHLALPNARVRGGDGGSEWYGGKGGVHALTTRVGGYEGQCRLFWVGVKYFTFTSVLLRPVIDTWQEGP